MSIDTEVKGEPDDVRDVARWMGTTRAGQLREGHQHVSMAWAQSSTGWEGASGEAYRGASATLGDASETYVRLLEHTAGTIRDYADALSDHKDQMARFRAEALGAGLTVDEYRIQDPRLSDVTYDAAPGPDDPGYAEFKAEQAAHERRVRVYESLEGRVEAARDFLTDWIACNLEPKVDFVGGEDLLTWKGRLPTPVRLGVGVGENTVKGAVKSVADLPEDVKKVGDALSTMGQGLAESARKGGDPEPVLKATIATVSGPAADVVTDGVKKGPWGWLAGGVVATGVDEAADAAAGGIVGEDARDPADYGLGQGPRAPYTDPPFLPSDPTEDTRPRGVGRR